MEYEIGKTEMKNIINSSYDKKKRRRREKEEKKNEKKKEQRTKERRNKFSAFLCVRGTIVESRDPGYMRSLQKGSVMRERGKKERQTDRQTGRQTMTDREKVEK